MFNCSRHILTIIFMCVKYCQLTLTLILTLTLTLIPIFRVFPEVFFPATIWGRVLIYNLQLCRNLPFSLQLRWLFVRDCGLYHRLKNHRLIGGTNWHLRLNTGSGGMGIFFFCKFFCYCMCMNDVWMWYMSVLITM